jgi:hypothetical protein
MSCLDQTIPFSRRSKIHSNIYLVIKVRYVAAYLYRSIDIDIFICICIVLSINIFFLCYWDDIHIPTYPIEWLQSPQWISIDQRYIRLPWYIYIFIYVIRWEQNTRSFWPSWREWRNWAHKSEIAHAASARLCKSGWNDRTRGTPWHEIYCPSVGKDSAGEVYLSLYRSNLSITRSIYRSISIYHSIYHSIYR